jgi:hypothetical protein
MTGRDTLAPLFWCALMAQTPLPQLLELMDRSQAFEDLRKAFQLEGRSVSEEAMRAAINGEAGALARPPVVSITPKAPVTPHRKQPTRHQFVVGVLFAAVIGLSGYAFHLHRIIQHVQETQVRNLAQTMENVGTDAKKNSTSMAPITPNEENQARPGQQQPLVDGFTVGPDRGGNTFP